MERSAQPDTLAAVQKMQEYIDDHLSDAISMSQLAKVSGYSQWHAAKLFREISGSTPFEYIRRLRLTKASQQLRDGHERILDVALDFVLASHEGFSRAFSREFGVSPSAYRQSKPPIRWFMPVKAQSSYLAMISREREGGREMADSTKTVFVQVIEKPARKLLLLRGKEATHYFAYCEEVGCDVWGMLCSIKEALFEPAGLWLPAEMRIPGTSEYVQGVELPADWQGSTPEGYDLIDLPA
ncbi:MAG: AraC family transcriptional regulator, partial [Symbiobacteriaceae bacterium]|nr:AraC family transcriptional regulator [Symbiobacteriaceae bacterium]